MATYRSLVIFFAATTTIVGCSGGATVCASGRIGRQQHGRQLWRSWWIRWRLYQDHPEPLWRKYRLRRHVRQPLYVRQPALKLPNGTLWSRLR